jgi:tRNA modification GTPase
LNNDTIAARATAPGAAALAVIRISGPEAGVVLGRIFRPSAPGARMQPRRLYHGCILGQDRAVKDEVLAVVMPGPNSYTGEDCVEIQGHGGPAVTRGVLEAVLAAGARLAEPGEFTKRAFLNGKLDLTQAEAVAELVAAPGSAAAGLALSALAGHLGGLVVSLRDRLVELRAQVCLAVDFPEDEEQFLGQEAFSGGVRGVLDEIGKLLAGFGRARPVREGALAVLAGPVNAGKSSLLNALIGRDRAIVSEAAGTTRDYIEESADLDGLAVRLADTAGLRGGGGEVERLGMGKSRELIGAADLVVLVLDRAADSAPEELDEIVGVAAGRDPGKIVVAANKTDLGQGASRALDALGGFGLEIIDVSAKTGQGLERLCAAMRRRILDGPEGGLADGAPAPNLRQAKALARAREELSGLLGDLATGVPADCLGVRLQSACDALGEITGAITPEGVLEAVFSRFCIGK